MKRLIKRASADIMVNKESLFKFMDKFYKNLLNKFSSPIFKCDFKEKGGSFFGYEIYIYIDTNEVIRRISEKIELEGDGEKRISLADIGDVIVKLNNGDIESLNIKPKFLVDKVHDFYYNYDYPTNIRCEEGPYIINDYETSFDYVMNLGIPIAGMIDFYKMGNRFEEYHYIFNIDIEEVDLEEAKYQNEMAMNGTGWWS